MNTTLAAKIREGLSVEHKPNLLEVFARIRQGTATKKELAWVDSLYQEYQHEQSVTA